MDIRNNTLKMTLNICFVLLSYMSFSQNENVMSKEMVRYSVKCELKSELDKILDNLKPEDQKLIFIINTFVKKDTYQISLTTSYDVEIKDNCVGFFEYKSKLFLLESIEYENFFSKVGKDTIQLNIKKPQKSNDIVQPYIDNLPYWMLEYSNGQFTTKLSSY
ncbi:hypothetical protein [Belliella pelovolcani]|uniref:hypothetical protein n=1 Tax=Belliella pelovolcani TaxID=529505 RepID=UPI00391B0C91